MDGCATGTEVHYRRRLSPHGMLRHRDGDVHFRSGVRLTECCPTRTVGFTSGGELGPPSESCPTGTEGLHPVGSSTHAGGFHPHGRVALPKRGGPALRSRTSSFAAGPPVWRGVSGRRLVCRHRHFSGSADVSAGVLADERLHQMARILIAILHRRALHEVCRRTLQRSAQSVVQSKLRAAHRIDNNAGGVR